MTTPAINSHIQPKLNLSPFLKLSGELRNLIYEYALSDDMDFCIHDMLHECGMPAARQGSPPPLLHVCHQIHREVSSIWFAEATFFHHNLYPVKAWLKVLQPEHRKLIRTIRLMPLTQPLNFSWAWEHARSIFRSLEMLESKDVLVMGMKQDGIRRPPTWYRGPGEIMSDGPVEYWVVKAEQRPVDF